MFLVQHCFVELTDILCRTPSGSYGTHGVVCLTTSCLLHLGMFGSFSKQLNSDVEQATKNKLGSCTFEIVLFAVAHVLVRVQQAVVTG